MHCHYHHFFLRLNNIVLSTCPIGTRWSFLNHLNNDASSSFFPAKWSACNLKIRWYFSALKIKIGSPPANLFYLAFFITTTLSEVLPHLQASKLACYSFMGAGRRHETPGSETKGLLLTAQPEAEHNGYDHWFPHLPCPTRMTRRWTLHMQWICITATERCT